MTEASHPPRLAHIRHDWQRACGELPDLTARSRHGRKLVDLAEPPLLDDVISARGLLGTVRIRVIATRPVFVGIAPETSVQAYLGNVARAEGTLFDARSADFRVRQGGASGYAPAGAHICSRSRSRFSVVASCCCWPAAAACTPRFGGAVEPGGLEIPVASAAPARVEAPTLVEASRRLVLAGYPGQPHGPARMRADRDHDSLWV